MPEIRVSEIINAIGGAVFRAASKPNTPMAKSDSAEITTEIKKELAKDPVVENALNLEPWYQSRVTWGSILAVASGIAGALGYVLDAEDIQQATTIAVAVASAIGGLFALYGRWVAKKPLGE